MMPNWLQFSFIKLIQNWLLLARNGFKLRINFRYVTREKNYLIGCLSFNLPLRVVTFDSCFDAADQNCKNQISKCAIIAHTTLQKLSRNLLNISAVAARNKPCFRYISNGPSNFCNFHHPWFVFSMYYKSTGCQSLLWYFQLLHKCKSTPM